MINPFASRRTEERAKPAVRLFSLMMVGVSNLPCTASSSGSFLLADWRKGQHGLLEGFAFTSVLTSVRKDLCKSNFVNESIYNPKKVNRHFMKKKELDSGK